jgi:hypothetical protein
MPKSAPPSDGPMSVTTPLVTSFCAVAAGNWRLSTNRGSAADSARVKKT